IYGMKHKWGAEILYLSVIPDDRNADVIGHVFLDFVETYGGTTTPLSVIHLDSKIMQPFHSKLR
ncbi:hypothetical protein B0H14DRAFT_2197207, partial [Mycena olivaceomarginata]